MSDLFAQTIHTIPYPIFKNIMELAVIGYPSKLGGADTELDHQMRIWTRMGIHVHVIHTGDLDDNLRAMRLEDRPGVTVHAPRDWKAARGMPAIAYCNGEFLKCLPEIRLYATRIWWVNCMCWLFPAEKEAHAAGLIDTFIYQTKRVLNHVSPILKGINKVFRGRVVRPHFDYSEFHFDPDKPNDKFRFCKISREDVGKYHPQTMWVYNTMVAPVLKEGHILGWDPERMPDAAGGSVPDWITAERAGARSVHEVYAKSHALIHMARPDQTENLPRVGFEAMATGTILICDKRGGWTDQIVDGKTGWLCDSNREFVYKASRCAFDQNERRQMAEDARARLETFWGANAAQNSWDEFFSSEP